MKRLLSRLARSMKTIAVCVVCGLLVDAPSANAGVLAFGHGYGGRTGLGTLEHIYTRVPTPIVTTNLVGRKIVQTAGGNWHTLLLAEDGTVFSFGEGDYGETGLGFHDDVSVATPIVTSNLGGRKIKQIAAGHALSLLLAEDGSVFSFGLNSFGQLGQGTVGGTANVATPIDTANLGGRKITQVAAGEWYGLLLADDGSVFSMGTNLLGRTGLGITSGETSIATPINTASLGGRKITQVAAGDTFALLLADDGTVFSFGNNASGQLGLGSAGGSTSIATPIDATNLGGRKITQVAAGAAHSLLLADDGSAFAFGAANGVLGIGLPPGATVASPTPIDTTNLGDLKVTQVSAGWRHSLVLAEDGRVFSFGSNDAGQLGIGSGTGIGVALVPIPINTTNLTGQFVTQVEAHFFTSFLLAEPALPGDFNLDGVVDAADYVVWRDSLGQTGAALAADGNQDHQVDADDYELWKSNFGQTLGLGSGAAPAVPEPATCLLCVLALGYCPARWRRRSDFSGLSSIRGARLLNSVSPG